MLHPSEQSPGVCLFPSGPFRTVLCPGRTYSGETRCSAFVIVAEEGGSNLSSVHCAFYVQATTVSLDTNEFLRAFLPRLSLRFLPALSPLLRFLSALLFAEGLLQCLVQGGRAGCDQFCFRVSTKSMVWGGG